MTQWKNLQIDAHDMCIKLPPSESLGLYRDESNLEKRIPTSCNNVGSVIYLVMK